MAACFFFICQILSIVYWSWITKCREAASKQVDLLRIVWLELWADSLTDEGLQLHTVTILVKALPADGVLKVIWDSYVAGAKNMRQLSFSKKSLNIFFLLIKL